MAKSPLAMRRIDEIERAHDDAQHIVEIVGDAAGELTERLHLLRLAELAFRRLAAADLVEQLPVGGGQPVARGGEGSEGVAGEARDENPDAADEQERYGDAGLQQHAGACRDGLPVCQHAILLCSAWPRWRGGSPASVQSRCRC